MEPPITFNYEIGSGVKLLDVWRESYRMIDSINPDIIHLHALWMASSHVAIHHAEKNNIPVVFAVRGALEEWAINQKKWKKRLAYAIFQRRDLKKNCVIACNRRPRGKAVPGTGI